MSINKILKKEGIEIVRQLDTLTVNTLAKKIAGILASSFPTLHLNPNNLFIHISRLNMYFAKLPNGISAKYFCKNRSIYFDCNLDFDNLTDVALHECIHYLQEKRDRRGNIAKLGLCDYRNRSLPGIGLNEAAVQLMAAKASNLQYENVKYFDINIKTNTPMYYPLECALVRQMAYVIGEDVLFDSTLHANNNFKNQYISLTSEVAFYKIQRNIDLLVDTQSRLECLYSALEDVGINEEFIKHVTNQIETEKIRVKKIFLATQKIILTSYFDNSINLAYSSKALENYRNRLYSFKNVIGYVEGDNFYNQYYIDKMQEIEKKYDFKPNTEIVALTIPKQSFFSKLSSKMKLLFGLSSRLEHI